MLARCPGLFIHHETAARGVGASASASGPRSLTGRVLPVLVDFSWPNETDPGQFENEANRTGTTEFVAPDLVEGTLIAAGLSRLATLDTA